MQTESSWRVWRDPEVAGAFADRRRGGLLGADAQSEVARRLVGEVDRDQLSVLDLGCGDGFWLQTLMQAYPVSRAVALDGSPAMLERAEIRFQDLGLFSDLVEYVEADFGDPGWKSRLPLDRFDVVISGFAIHHSEDDRKRALYEDIFHLLGSGGVFINIEHVASMSQLGEALFEDAYAETVYGFRKGRGEDVDLDEVRDEIRKRPDKSANRLTPVDTQLDWLKEIGFRDVDCYWKMFELAVLAGYRP